MRGISPLVASVLLIAISLTLAGILTTWGVTFIKGKTETFGNQTTSECDIANFRIFKCSYNSTESEITLTLENRANVELKNLVAYINYPNASTFSYDLNDTLPSVALKTFNVSEVSDGYSTIVVKTHCPQISESSRCQ
jgi:flagellin-like protein